MAEPDADGATPSRREQNKALKRARIARAAREVFERDGFERATVQEISGRAGVGAGTLFRYAATKAELLMMVSNDDFARACDEGRRAMSTAVDPVDRLVALLTPAVVWSRERDDNTLVYQRESWFGDPSEQYRAVALDIADRLEQTIAQVLQDAWRAQRRTPPPSATLAARVLFAAVQLATSRAATTRRPTHELLTTVAQQASLVVGGYLNGPDRTDAGDR